MIVDGLVVAIAIWRGMMAHDKIADSIVRVAESTELIEKIIRRDQTGL